MVTAAQIDKGVPYYFWAMTALLRGSIDSGYVLAHQAAEEDSRTSSGLKYPDTPAYALVSLNYDKDDQAFKSWVDEKAGFLKGSARITVIHTDDRSTSTI